jgi:hypothetical protein
MTLASRPKTFPEIVGSFRRFVAEAAADRPIIIGIDELDKIGSVEKVELFLSDVKAIFGIRRCYYLISVSDDAIAGFQRRGMRFKDAFDSSLDEVVKVGYLDFAEAKRLLGRRVIGLPMPFVALCYCFSGGLARDLIRATRILFDLSHANRVVELSDLTHLLIARDLKANSDATLRIIYDLLEDEGELLRVSRWSSGLEVAASQGGRLSPVDLLEQCQFLLKKASSVSIGEQEAEHLTIAGLLRELASSYYYCATILEFFGEDFGRERLEIALADTSGPRSLAMLAKCKQAFSIDAAYSWQMVSEFREAWEFDALKLTLLSPRTGSSALSEVPSAQSAPQSPDQVGAREA